MSQKAKSGFKRALSLEALAARSQSTHQEVLRALVDTEATPHLLVTEAYPSVPVGTLSITVLELMMNGDLMKPIPVDPPTWCPIPSKYFQAAACEPSDDFSEVRIPRIDLVCENGLKVTKGGEDFPIALSRLFVDAKGVATITQHLRVNVMAPVAPADLGKKSKSLIKDETRKVRQESKSHRLSVVNAAIVEAATRVIKDSDCKEAWNFESKTWFITKLAKITRQRQQSLLISRNALRSERTIRNRLAEYKDLLPPPK